MNKIKLKNGNEYEINDGASLSRIEIPVNEGASEGVVVDLNVKGNLDNVQFLMDEEIIGEYTDMKLSAPCSIETNDEGMTVVFGISEKTDIEKRLDAIESGQEIQDGAIGELAEVVSEVVGGAV